MAKSYMFYINTCVVFLFCLLKVNFGYSKGQIYKNKNTYLYFEFNTDTPLSRVLRSRLVIFNFVSFPNFTEDEPWEIVLPSTLTILQKNAEGIDESGLPCESEEV